MKVSDFINELNRLTEDLKGKKFGRKEGELHNPHVQLALRLESFVDSHGFSIGSWGISPKGVYIDKSISYDFDFTRDKRHKHGWTGKLNSVIWMVNDYCKDAVTVEQLILCTKLKEAEDRCIKSRSAIQVAEERLKELKECYREDVSRFTQIDNELISLVKQGG